MSSYFKEVIKHKQFNSLDELNLELRKHLFLHKRKMTKSTYGILRILAQHSAKHFGVSFLKGNTLAGMSQVSIKTVWRSIKQLNDLGIISTVQTRNPQGRVTSNIYVINKCKLPAEVYEKHIIERMEYLKGLPYSDYLQTSHWKILRFRALKSAGFRCSLCNSDGLLDVHHRTYERLGNEKLKDLVALCRTCHSRFHDKLTKV